MSKVSILIFYFLALMCSNNLLSQEKIKTLGILNLETTNLRAVPESDVKTLTSRLHAELSKIGRFQIVEMGRVEEIVREQGLQQSGACANDQCIAQVGFLLGVEWMLAYSEVVQKVISLYQNLLVVTPMRDLAGLSRYFKHDKNFLNSLRQVL